MRHTYIDLTQGDPSEPVGRSFASTEQAVAAILRLLAEQLGMRSSFLTRSLDDEGRFEVLAAYNAPGGCAVVPGTVLVLPQGETSPVLRENARADPALKGFPQIGSYGGVPLLLSDGRFFGSLCAVDPEPRVFEPDQVQLMVMLTRLVATQIERDQELAEYQRSQEELRHQAERFQLLVEHARDIIFRYRLAPPPGFDYVSPASTTIGGYTPEELYADPDLLLKVVYPEDRPLLEAALQSPAEYSESLILRWVHKDGRVIWVEHRVAPIYDVAGNVVAVEGVTRDITHLKEVEAALQARLRLAAFVADVANALARSQTLQDILSRCAGALVQHFAAAFARIWTLNTEENVLELQASAGMYTHIDGAHSRVPVGQQKIGLIAQERQPHLTNQVIGDPYIQDQQWAAREGIVAFAGYPLLIEDRLVGVMALFSRQPLTEAIFDAMAAVANRIAEVIERKRTEEALRESEEHLASARKAARLGTCQLDLPTFVLTASETCKANFGRRPDDSLTYEEVFAAILPEHRDRVWVAIQQAIEQHTDYDVEYPITWPDSSPHWILSRGRCLYAADGTPLRVLGITLDLTNHWQAEQALQRYSEQLHALSWRLVQVQEDERKLLASDLHQSVVQWLSGALLRVEVARRFLVRGDLADAGQELTEIEKIFQRSIRELRTTIVRLHAAELTLRGLVPALAHYIEQWRGQTGIATTLTVEGQPRQLPQVVETALYRICQEALTNVAKHARVTDASITLRFAQDQVVLTVRDEGVGFPVRPLRAASAGVWYTREGDDMPGEHVGLLDICERTHILGGEVDLESKPGEGTSLTVIIPVNNAGGDALDG